MYDDEVFADRFRLQLTIVEMQGLSGHFHAHIVYEIAVAQSPQNSAEFPIVQHHLIRLKSIVLPSPNDNMYDDELIASRFRYQLTMF